MSIQQLLQHEKRAKQNIEKTCKELAATLTEILFQKELAQGRTSDDLKKDFTKHFQQEMKKNFNYIRERTESGTYEIIKAFLEISVHKPTYSVDEVMQDLAHILTIAASSQKDPNEYIEACKQGKTLQEHFQLKDKTLQALYQAAKHLYEQKVYEKAANAFGVLTVLNPKYATFWLGLGHAETLCNRFEPALLAYAMASHLNPDDPTAYLHSAECYEILNDGMNAVNSLELAFEAIEDKKEYEPLKQQIIAERKRLL
jgi:type III secretion system low calcium response chaperone LcrH/SycD